MSSTLRRISPAHFRRRTDQLASAASVPQPKQLTPGMAVDDSTAERRRSLARLKQIRSTLEEVIFLADAQQRQTPNAAGTEPGRTALKAETHQLLSQIRAIIGANGARQTEIHAAHSLASSGRPHIAEPSSVDTKRVQLRLSKPLVKVLTAFSKSGQSPGKITERSLWKDQDIKDAAMLLGVSSEKAGNRKVRTIKTPV